MKKILPILSNQKMNAYLKEIEAICGIENELTLDSPKHICYDCNTYKSRSYCKCE